MTSGEYALTFENPAAIIQATLGVFEQVKLLLLPNICQFLELSLDGELLDGSIGDLRNIRAILMQPHSKHVAQSKSLGVHVKLLACSSRKVVAAASLYQVQTAHDIHMFQEAPVIDAEVTHATTGSCC